MATHDIIGDCLNSIKMASSSGQISCTVPYTRLAHDVCAILKSEGFIAHFAKKEVSKGISIVEVSLKYVSGLPSITGLKRHSTPGCRRYYASKQIPRVLGGVGVAVLTTSRGVMTDAQARRQNVGGELLAQIW